MPSIWMKSLCVRNRALIGFIGVLLTVLFLLGALFTSAPSVAAYFSDSFLSGLQAPQTPVVDDDDLISLLSLSLGGRDVAVAVWSNMNLFERQALRDQAVRIATMAQNAERDGILSCPDVARTLRWGTASFLADAWEGKILSELDLTEYAARSFYEANQQWYTDEGGAPIPFENVRVRVRDDMIRFAILQRIERLNPR